MKQAFAHHYDQKATCKSTCLLVVVLLLFIGAEACLFVFLEEHYWIIPTFIMFNMIVTFILVRYVVIRAFVFSFAQKWIVKAEIKDLNSKYCK